MKEKGVVEFEAVAFENRNGGYASDYETNALYKVDMSTSMCIYIMAFPNEAIDGKRLHCTALYVESEVYFIPMSGEYISIFTPQDEKIFQIEIPEIKKEQYKYNQKFKFSGAYYNNGFIYIMPYTYPAILKLDIHTKEVFFISDWVPSDEIFFRSKMCIDGTDIFIPNGRNNMVLKFNIETEKASILRIGNYNNGSVCMHKFNDFFWIAPRLNGSVICWNSKKNVVVQELIQYPEDFDAGRIVFSEMLNIDGKIYLIPAEANGVLSIDDNGLSIEKLYKKNDHETIVSMFETDDDYYFCKVNDKIQSLHHFKVNKKDGSTSPYIFKVKDESLTKKNYYSAFIAQNRVMCENVKFTVDDFLNLYLERR